MHSFIKLIVLFPMVEVNSAEQLAQEILGLEVEKIRIIGRANKAKDDDIRYPAKGTIYVNVPERNSIALHDIIYEAYEEMEYLLQHYPEQMDNLDRILFINFIDCSFEQLPINIGHLHNHIQYLTFCNCHNFSSLESLKQFSNMKVLVFRHCKSIKSLNSFQSFDSSSNLYSVAFKRCGLKVDKNDDWNRGIKSLSGINSDRFVLTIQECNDLKCLPSCIYQLGEKKILRLNLLDNESLWKLPNYSGRVKPIIDRIHIAKCTNMTYIPNLQCSGNIPTVLSIVGCPILMKYFKESGVTCLFQGDEVNRSIEHDDGTKAIGELHDFRKYFKMCGRKLFFRVSLLKMHIRRERLYVVDRFYRPGGKGFEMCRDRFEQMNEIAVKKKM